MLVHLRAAICAALAVTLTATSGFAQAPPKTLSYETMKPRAEVDASQGYNRVLPAAFSEMAPAPGEMESRQPVPSTSATPKASQTCDNGSSCPSCEWDHDSYFYGFNDGAWFGGVDYLLVRPHFSEAVAYVQRDTVSSGGNSTITDQTVAYDFAYQSSVRAFFGYRLCECGGEIRFSYWNFNNGENTETDPVPTDLSTIYAGHLEINAQLPGETLHTQATLDVNSFDIDFSKRIPLGDCCSCCPVWDLQWSAGVRIAEVDRHNNNQRRDSQDTLLSSGLISQNFVGAGPRMGLEGRRYFGDGCVSAYMKGNWSLLLGSYDTERRRDDFPGGGVTVTTIQRENYIRTIPVMELEVGASWQVRPHFMLTAGYLFQAWWDLGMFEQMQGTNFGPQDDSNIMSFDGLMLRAEFVF